MYKLVIKQCADQFVFAIFAASDYADVKFVKVSCRYHVRVYNKTTKSHFKIQIQRISKIYIRTSFTRLVLTAIATKTQKPE